MFAPRAPATRPAQAALERTLLAHLGFEGDAVGGGGGGTAAAAAADTRQTAPPPLDRARAAAYLRSGLRSLPAGFVSLSAGRPWIVYWISHGLNLLGEPLTGDDAADAVAFLAACQHPAGGFGGSPGQLPHLAPTYAAVAALASLDAATGGAALAALDAPRLAEFLARQAVPPSAGGGFAVCAGGEVDTRGAYTALACADLAGLDTRATAERAGVLAFLAACQTPEGGLAGSPGGEAHGGYTLCGLAAALLAVGVRGGGDSAPLPPADAAALADALDLRRLAVWAARCQSPASGGFAGRTGKLVDGCYSYWQGAVFALIDRAGGVPLPPRPPPSSSSFNPATAPPLPPPPPLPPGMAAPPGPIARAAAAVVAADEALANAEGAAAAAAARDAADWARAGAAMASAGAAALAALDPTPAPSTTSHHHHHHPPLFNAPALVAWVRACCQAPPPRGGLRDKPGAAPDYYHTCYCLSGLAAVDAALGRGRDGGGGQEGGDVDPTTGGPWRLAPADPLLNVTVEAVGRARARFG